MSYILGCDVSHHQGKIDFFKMKAAGAHFVIIKSTESNNFTDSRALLNIEGAIKAGLTWGLFHFVRDRFWTSRRRCCCRNYMKKV